MVSFRSARRKALVLAIVTAMAAAGSATAAEPPRTAVLPASVPAPTRAADPIAHDPTMVKEGAWYYLVITGDSGRPNTFLPVKRSKDLVHWTELAPVFTSLPPWILPALGLGAADAPKDLWAPDLSYVGGEWRLYYAISQFGKNNSVIGLVTTKTLDPASRDFRWVDRGLVLQSKPSGTVDEFNAIDADFSTDAAGNGWLAFGSFWTGIKMRRIDVATGKLSAADTKLYPLATRPAAPDAIEGPSIVRHGTYYYLFVAFDYCCRGVDSDYRVMVGRSRAITGPYVDRAGVPLLSGGGTEVLRGYNEFQGTGGADVYSTGGVDYFVNHYYDATDNGVPKVNVRTLTWAGGWPAVSDPVNPSRSIGHGSAYVAIVPRGSTAMVQDDGCGYEGAALVLGADRDSQCQQWQIDDRGTGSRILNRYSNKVAEIAGCDNIDGGNLAQWGWVGFLPNNDCQRWSFAAAADGYSSVAAIAPGHRVWNVVGGRSAAGGDLDVTTAPVPTDPGQQFRFQPIGTVLLAGTANQTDALGVSDCWDIHGRHFSFGGHVLPEAQSASACQHWRMDSVAGTANYTVTNVETGEQLTAGYPGGRGGGLRVSWPTAATVGSRTWTLQPDNGGTWTLASGGTKLSVRVLIP